MRRRARGAHVPNNQTAARVGCVDKLTGDPFNPKPKSGTAIGSSGLPVDLQWGVRARSNVNIDEAPGDEVPEPVATQQRLARD